MLLKKKKNCKISQYYNVLFKSTSFNFNNVILNETLIKKKNNFLQRISNQLIYKF